jgi:hypothetical protein
VVASDEGARLQCYCFGAQEEKTFFISAAGVSPDPFAPKDPNATRLNPLMGTWPPYDLPTDTMELFVEVKVYLCKSGECTATSCERLRTRDLRDMDEAGKAKTPRHDCDINDGEAKDKIADTTEKGAGTAIGFIPFPK